MTLWIWLVKGELGRRRVVNPATDRSPLCSQDNFLDSYLVDLAAQTDPTQNAHRGQLAQGLQQHSGVPMQMQPGQPPIMVSMPPGVQMGAGLQIPQMQQQAMPNFSSAPLQTTGFQMGGLGGLGSMQGFPGMGSAGFGLQTQQLAQPAAPSAAQALPQSLMVGTMATSAPASGRGRGGRGGGRGSGGRGGRGAGKSNAKSEPDPSDSQGEDGSDSSSDGEGEPKSRKKQNMNMDDAERRHQALQEKNRRAQRRFRERQKVGCCAVGVAVGAASGAGCSRR
jgi:hypothetical protein